MSNNNNDNSSDQQRPPSRRTHSRRNKRMITPVHPFGMPLVVTGEDGVRYALYLPVAQADNPQQPTGQLTPALTQYSSPHVQRPHRRRRRHNLPQRSEPPSDMAEMLEGTVKEEAGSVASVEVMPNSRTNALCIDQFNRQAIFVQKRGRFKFQQLPKPLSSNSLKKRLAQHVGPLNTDNLPMHRISKLLRTMMANAVDFREDEEMGFAWKLINALLTKRTKLSQQEPCRLEFASAYDLWETLTQDLDNLMMFDDDNCGGDEEAKRKNDKEPNSLVINPMSQSSILTILASSDSWISGISEGMAGAMSNHDWMNALLLAAFSPSTHERTKVLSSYLKQMSKPMAKADRALLTYFEVLLGQIPTSLSIPEFLAGNLWRKHLAVILNLQSICEQSRFKTNVEMLKQTLSQMNKHVSVQICDLLAFGTIPPSGLIGWTSSTDELFASIDQIPHSTMARLVDSIQITELYERASGRLVEKLLPYKILLAQLMNANDLNDVSWSYCKEVARLYAIAPPTNLGDLTRLIELCYQLKPITYEWNGLETPAWIKLLENQAFGMRNSSNAVVGCLMDEDRKPTTLEMIHGLVEETTADTFSAFMIQSLSINEQQPLNEEITNPQPLTVKQSESQQQQQQQQIDEFDHQKSQQIEQHSPQQSPQQNEQLADDYEPQPMAEFGQQQYQQPQLNHRILDEPSQLHPQQNDQILQDFQPQALDQFDQQQQPQQNEQFQQPLPNEQFRQSQQPSRPSSPEIAEPSPRPSSPPSPNEDKGPGFLAAFKGIFRNQKKNAAPVAILPDDSKKTLYFCPIANKWIDRENPGASTNSETRKPPPIVLPSQIPVTKRIGYQVGQRKHVDVWAQSNATTQDDDNESVNLIANLLASKDQAGDTKPQNFFVPR